MNTLTCQVCGFIWTPKFKEHPMRCGSRPCRSMLWDGHRKGEYRQTHGMTATPTYRSWQSMIDRCRNPNNPRWSAYGGAGVSFDPRWVNFESFLMDMGVRPDGTTLDRFPDRTGDYTKLNCRWATPKEQQNNLRNNVRVEYMGQSKTIREWSDHCGISYVVLVTRLRRGWTPERALNEPVHYK